MTDADQRTERPSPQRLKKAREEGRFPDGRELSAALQFTMFTAMLAGLAGAWWPGAKSAFRSLIAASFEARIDAAFVERIVRHGILPGAAGLAACGLGLTAVGLFAQLALTGFGFAPSRLAPDLARLNVVANLRELPKRGGRAAQETLVLLPLFALICYAVVRSHLDELLRLPLLGLEAGARAVGSTLGELLWRLAGGFLAWGLIDAFRQRRRYLRELRMTKQEIREELKQNEGNPEVKMKIRMLRRALLRRRMISEVQTATVVVMNPSHFAVALRYSFQGATAPKVVAKGKNYLALRIRERALLHQVPVVENPPLARALYKQVAVGQEIPAHLYRAVAEVLAYIFRLGFGRRSGTEPAAG